MPHGTNRTEWTFTYTAKDLAEAARKQRKDRLDRRDRWEKLKGEVMAEIKEKGMSVDEGVSAQMSRMKGSTYATADDGPRIRIDPSLQYKLTQAHGRAVRHDDAAREYDGWVNALAANPAKSFDLTIDDWLYFFGPNGRLVDEDKDDE